MIYFYSTACAIYFVLFIDISNSINVALHKETKQSSTLNDFGDNFESYLANDGIRNLSSGRGGCAHTNNDLPYAWWMVDLGRLYQIEQITVYGRTDCCENRHSDLEIRIYNEYDRDASNSTQETTIYKEEGQVPPLLNFTTKICGRYVKILRDNNDDGPYPLTLCEVEIYPTEIDVSFESENVSNEQTFAGSIGMTNGSSCAIEFINITRNLSNDINPNVNEGEKCHCPCFNNTTISNVGSHTRDELLSLLAPVLQKQRQELQVDKARLSSIRRRKTSAFDDRKSSKSIGIIAVTFLVSVVGVIVFLDIQKYLLKKL